MSHLNRIAARHRPDRWTDVIFIMAAVLLATLSIGSLTSKAVGPVPEHGWTLTVFESNLEIGN